VEFKNAAAICLISFFSATLVLLIARTLDVQAVARLEPQLRRIADELEALRKKRRMPAPASAGQPGATLADSLIVYYWHGNTRCPTCRSIESQAHKVVQSDFASELKSGAVTWQVANYEDPAAADLVQKFDILASVVVLARMQAGQIAQWKRLDRVGALVDDGPAYAAYLRAEIRQLLQPAEPPAAAPGADAQPRAGKSAKELEAASVPRDLPIPE